MLFKNFNIKFGNLYVHAVLRQKLVEKGVEILASINNSYLKFLVIYYVSLPKVNL